MSKEEEKVIYEVGVQGVGSTVSQINSIGNALADISNKGAQAFSELSQAFKLLENVIPDLGIGREIDLVKALRGEIRQTKQEASSLKNTFAQQFNTGTNAWTIQGSGKKQSFAETVQRAATANGFYGTNVIKESNGFFSYPIGLTKTNGGFGLFNGFENIKNGEDLRNSFTWFANKFRGNILDASIGVEEEGRGWKLFDYWTWLQGLANPQKSLGWEGLTRQWAWGDNVGNRENEAYRHWWQSKQYGTNARAWNRSLNQKLLGYTPPWTDKSSTYFDWMFGTGPTVLNDVWERHNRAENARARNRRRWGNNNLWSDLDDFSVVPFTDVATTNGGSIVPVGNTSLDVLRGAPSFTRAGTAFSKIGGASNIASKAFSFAKFLPYIGKVCMAFMLLDKVIKKAIEAFHKLIEFAQVNESWRILRQSFSFGTTRDALSATERAIRVLGGDPASASASYRRWSNDLNMLAYGGTGGSVMEAARLFGLNIMGTGRYGFARPEELERNIISLMSKLSQGGQQALANVLGLNDYQRWAYSNGQQYYDKLKQRSLAQTAWGTDAELTEEHNVSSLLFKNSLGQLFSTFKEFGGYIGEMFIPCIVKLMDFIEGLFEIINFFLRPLAKIINQIEWLLSARWWRDHEEIERQVDKSNSNKNVNINFNGPISLGSLGLDESATDEQIRSRLSNLFDPLGEELAVDMM